MATASNEATSICSHCDRSIPSTNIDLHYVHCSRNLERCKHCGDMVPKKHAEEHYLNTHASELAIALAKFIWKELQGQVNEHQEVCGNRTELCHLCRRYVRLRERNDHEANCNGVSYDSVGVPDNTVSPSRRDARAAEREQGGRRRPPQEFSQRRVLFTIAITGIAVILGSLFFQRKTENTEMH